MFKNQNIIQKFNQLYIIKRSKYLILSDKGNYVTFDKKKYENAKYLTDFTVYRHLEGKSTLGVFATRRASKFICFDVDIKDIHKAKWVTYKVHHALMELGVPKNYIHISHSGNKGYHMEVFFSEPIENYVVKEFHSLVLTHAELIDIDYGDVELRPTAEQGVKLPLGKHFKTKGNKRCWYVDYDKGLEPVRSYNYILNIEPVQSATIYDILNREKDSLLEEEVIEVDNTDDYIEQKYEPLPSYKQNVNEDETIEAIEKLLSEGLPMQGTRHNSLFKLAKYFKWLGLSGEQVNQELINWMEWQDESKYSMKRKDWLKDIEEIVEYIFLNDIQLTVEQKEIEVSYNEMVQVVNICKSKNEKLLAYCLLIHSKRYSNASGVFYMSFNQMATASGLVEKSARNIINKLETNGLIEIIARNQMVTKKNGAFETKKPNKYKVNIQTKPDSNVFKIDSELEYKDSFNSCMVNLFTTDVLKELLPRRQFESIVN
ncbi:MULTISPECIES: TOTE conflict system archaeo-eukaryotic primase domain-containing protein [Bacillaceae]|uniref:Helix-turn-helix domain-containing protein n=1 Tax=Evansella alkalicola TaxID=745819 RepID=A0ABS6JPR2_9BACI|nr:MULTISPECIES: helix-turn-helix domain-containing protein [Bacillaceae]MBU9720548.1 helix-turn-helix domain-containing protein [Bacillus alkalicola]